MSFIDKYYAIFNNSVGQHSVTINRAEFANLLGVFSKEEEELNQLKSDNEELKKVSCKFKDYCTCDTEKLKQTIAEIKEIAKSEVDSKEFMAIQCMLNGSIDNKNKVLIQILQKISECEVNNG